MSSSASSSSNGKGKATVSAAGPQSQPHNALLHHNVVFLFIPNIIGYTRVLLAASSLYFMRWHPKYCTWLYIVSCLLDAFDGMAARRFNQSTTSTLLPPSLLPVSTLLLLFVMILMAQRASLVRCWTWLRIGVRLLVCFVIYVLHIRRIHSGSRQSS